MKPLNSHIIDKILYACPMTQNVYKGVKARGDIYMSSTPYSSYVVNTGFEWDGRHWVLIYFSPTYTIFFDSYGFSPDMYDYFFLGERGGVPLMRNTARVQSYGSSVCGHWVIYMLYHLLAGKTLHSILKRFIGQSTRLNDLYVFYFVKKLAWEYAKVLIM